MEQRCRVFGVRCWVLGLGSRGQGLGNSMVHAQSFLATRYFHVSGIPETSKCQRPESTRECGSYLRADCFREVVVRPVESTT
jgi:hypothetical protein